MREAVVLPGGMYGPHAPLLMFAADAAEARGARIVHVEWNDPASITEEDRGPRVVAQVPPVTGRPLLIGKSRGTFAAPVAAEHGLPSVWLTPLLTDEWVVSALRRATAPMLLVGGTADGVWDGELARSLTPHVLEVEGADHGMYVPGRLAASAEVLGRVATAVEDFLDQVVWPSSG